MRILATVSYKGTNYCGWAKQIDKSSIQGEIEKVLSTIFNQEVCIYGAGRTDANVHALGQTFHFDVDKEVDLARLRYSMNKMLPNDIHIESMKEVSRDFHARYSAKGKHYRYILSLGENNPFKNDVAYCLLKDINEDLLSEALKLFIGTHNYQDFTSKEEDEQGFVRTISDIKVNKVDNDITIDLYGNGFMRYMIRYIIGSAVVIAQNKESLSFINKHLDSINRDVISYKAPGNGLYLVEVIY